MNQRGKWTGMLRRAGAAYAAIIVSIVGIKIATEDVSAAKKPTVRSQAAMPGEGTADTVVPLPRDDAD